MFYKYYVYGLHVNSEILLDEAYGDDSGAEADVEVRIGQLPKEILEKTEDKSEDEFAVLCTSHSLFFRIPHVAGYIVEKNRITVVPIAEATSQPVKTFLLGSGFGYCMVLRKMVVMHGGAVEFHGKGIIVTGESGAGKSTVTNALRMKDFQFVADDVCALQAEGERMHINMAYPQQKLCRDAALRMGYELSELIYINEERDKFAVRLKDGYLPQGAPFHYLFELQLAEDNQLSFDKIEGHEKLFTIIRNIYRGESAFETWGMPPEYMKGCLRVASTVEVYRIKRPQDMNTLDTIVAFIMDKVQDAAE